MTFARMLRYRFHLPVYWMRKRGGSGVSSPGVSAEIRWCCPTSSQMRTMFPRDNIRCSDLFSDPHIRNGARYGLPLSSIRPYNWWHLYGDVELVVLLLIGLPEFRQSQLAKVVPCNTLHAYQLLRKLVRTKYSGPSYVILRSLSTDCHEHY